MGTHTHPGRHGLATLVFLVAAHASAAEPPAPVLTPALWLGDTLYVSGQGTRDRATGAEPEPFEGKVRQALDNCGGLLKEQGLGFQHVVNVHLYLTDTGKLAAVDRVYRRYFPRRPPARSVIGVPALPGGVPMEITVTAHRRGGRPLGARPGAIASPAVEAGGVVYLSGQTAPGAGDFAAEVRRTIDGARAALRAAKLDLRDVASGIVFLADIADYDQMNAIDRTYFDGPPGARTTVASGPLPGGARIGISFIAAQTGRTVVLPPDEKPGALFVPAVAVGETVYLSGRAGYAEGGVVPQVDELMARMSRVLAAAGLDFSHVVDAKVYLTDMGDFAAMNAAYRKHFPGRPPTRTTVGVAQLHRGSRVEITLLAGRRGR